ncbi:MAG: peptide chain release factor 1 [Verrucomicrobiales bacterium]
MDFEPLIEKKRNRLAEIEQAMSAEDFYFDQRRAAEFSQEYKYIKKLLANWERFAGLLGQLEDNRELAKGEDEEMAALADEEIPELEKSVDRLGTEIQYALLPRDNTEDRDVIIEIRAGTGGDEASLFAGDVLRMYQRYAELQGWTVESLEASPSEVGGFKEVTVKVSGEEVFRRLKYESGVHRVQRVPETETQGRIHTSTATVAVMPEAEEVDVELKPEELNIQATRSGGPGGQHVNTTDSCIQVTHLPSGIMVRCQDGRSQTKNKEKALTILRSKLLEAKQQEEAEKYSEQRRNLIGSGGREEKVRTYNFPQNRVTDHRIGLTLYNLEGVLAGEVDELIEGLHASEMAERLQEAGLS